jgi:hypothetical protein
VGYANARHLETLEGLVDLYLIFDIQMRRSLVQKEDPRQSIKCSGEQHSLFLSAR